MIAERTTELFSKLDFASTGYLLLVTPRGMIKQNMLPTESHGLRLLHELVESSATLNAEFLAFLK